MSNLHKAIRAIHNNVISINGDTEETIIATDIDGNEITINWTNVEAWTDPEEYKTNRLLQYPSLQDFAEAYTEKEIGGDSTKWDAYVINYNKVRSDNPKE